MSSMPEETKTTVSAKRGYFLKSDSLQKIKCSAVYPFQLAGLKINRDTLKQLFETLIIKARTLSQKALLVFMLVTLKLLGAAIVLWVKVCAKTSTGDDDCHKQKKIGAALSFHERLISKAHKLHRNTKSKTDLKSFELNASEIQKHEPVISQDEVSVTCTKNLTVHQVRPVEKEETENTYQGRYQEKLFKVCVYCGAMFVYLQLLMLSLALATTRIPPGLVFLISSLLLIGVIIFKVFFKEQNQSIEAKNSTKLSRHISSSVENIYFKVEEAIKTNQTQRQGRTRHRSLTIDWENTRISKVKLL